MKLPDDHSLENLPPLRERPERRVVRTRHRGRPSVTRVFLEERVSQRYAANLELAALRGAGQLHGLPRSVELPFAGYQCAARLGRMEPPRLPEVLAAGVTPDGYAFVTTEWIAGPTLRELIGRPDWDREGLLLEVLCALEALHAARVVYGDLKPENVVWAEVGRVMLIDLDTLREVPDARHGAPTLDLTRSWAAPEQLHDHLAFLASDLWAWAGLVQSVFPRGAPAPFAALVDACRITDPRRRPTTTSAVRHLRDREFPLVDWLGEPVAARGPRTTPGDGGVAPTERVPEAGTTDRVPAEAGPTVRVPAEEASPAPRPPVLGPGERAGGGPRRVLGGLALAVALCCGAPFTAARAWNDRYVDGRADDLFAALRTYKTDPSHNRDPAEPALLVEMTELPWYHWTTPRFAAVAALTRVWAARLQDKGTTWNAERFRALEAVVAGGGDRPEALLARGSLYAHGCRVRSEHPSAAGMCDRAEQALDQLLAQLEPDPATNWLLVEAAWARMQVGSLRAIQAAEAGLPEAAARHEAVLAWCARGVEVADWAPVNGPELVEDCLAYAGWSAAVADYVAWGTWLVDRDGRDGVVDASTYDRLYDDAGPRCDGTVRVSRDRRQQLVFTFDKRADPWCVALGHAARGCPERAREVIAASREEAPHHPWDTLLASLPAETRADCLR